MVSSVSAFVNTLKHLGFDLKTSTLLWVKKDVIGRVYLEAISRVCGEIFEMNVCLNWA